MKLDRRSAILGALLAPIAARRALAADPERERLRRALEQYADATAELTFADGGPVFLVHRDWLPPQHINVREERGVEVRLLEARLVGHPDAVDLREAQVGVSLKYGDPSTVQVLQGGHVFREVQLRDEFGNPLHLRQVRGVVDLGRGLVEVLGVPG